MAATLSLAQMVDLALGTPEVGAVNFNVLHSLLHAMLNKLELSETKGDIKEEDRNFLSTKQNEKTEAGKDGNNTGDKQDSVKSESDNTGSISQTRSPYHQLEEKVANLQQQMDSLNKLPTNDELFERSKKGDGERARPVADMWQNMQLTKRVDTNEEGIGKVSETSKMNNKSSDYRLLSLEWLV